MAEPFSLSAFVITSTVAGILGNRTDAGVIQACRSVAAHMRQASAPVNHDIQRAVRKSQLQATLLAAEARLKALGASPSVMGRLVQAVHVSGHEVEWLNSARKYVGIQLGRLKAPEYVPVVLASETDVESLLASGEGEATEKVRALRDALAGTMLLELRLSVPNVPPRFAEMINAGWDEADPSAGRERWDWFEAVCAFFAHELKHNQPLANIVQGQLLVELKAEVAALSESLGRAEELLGGVRAEQAEGTAVVRGRFDESDAKMEGHFARAREADQERHEQLMREIAGLGEKLGSAASETDARSAGGEVRPQALAPDASQDEVPFQAIDAPALFEGREAEVGLLEEKLRSNHKVIIIRGGLGGIGKTALAATVAHRVRDDFAEGVLWARLDVTDPESALILFISAFGRQHASFQLKYLASDAARAGYYRSILSKKRCLVVLDNVEDAEQVVNLLPSASPSKVLITTRYSLKTEIEGAYELNLTTLSTEAGAHLLAELLGEPVADEPEAREQLARELGCLPLAIRIGAGVMRELEWTAAGYLKRLKESLTLDWLGEDGSSVSVRKSFAISYEELPNEAVRRAFRALGAFQHEAVSAGLIAHVLGCPQAEAERRILTLVRRGLVEVEADEQSSVLLHPLIRRYAYELLAEAGEEGVVHESAGRWYREKLSAWDAGRGRFDYGVLGTAADIAGGLQGARHYQQAGHFTEAQDILVAIADIATLYGRDAALLGRLDELSRVTDLAPWLQLYRAHSLITSKDAETFAAGEAILENLTRSTDLKMASAALISLAKARLLQRRYTDSERLLRRSKALKEQLSPPDLKGLAFIENELAHVSMHNGGRFSDALESHQRALELQRRTSDAKGMAYTLRRIASIQLRHFDRPEEAWRSLVEAEKLAARVGANLILVLILLEKAAALRRLKFFGHAVAELEAALDTARKCDDPFPEAHVLKRLGLTYEDVELYGRAGDCLRRCKTLLDGIDPLEAAGLEASLGRLQRRIDKLRLELEQVGALLGEAEARGERGEARRLRRRAKRLRQKLNLEPALIRLGHKGTYSVDAVGSG